MANIERARMLTFESLDDVLAEALRVAERPDAPTRGKWTAAENVWHVARYVQASVEGYPFKSPLLFKLLGPLLKSGMIRKAMKSGFNTPASVKKHMEPGGSEVGEITMDRAMATLEEWTQKAGDQGFIPTNPVFGKMTREQWVALHCRHAEMHLGLIEI